MTHYNTHHRVHTVTCFVNSVRKGIPVFVKALLTALALFFIFPLVQTARSDDDAHRPAREHRVATVPYPRSTREAPQERDTYSPTMPKAEPTAAFVSDARMALDLSGAGMPAGAGDAFTLAFSGEEGEGEGFATTGEKILDESSGAPSAKTMYDESEVSTPARVESTFPPTFPERAKALGITNAVVTLRVLVNERGMVERARFVSGNTLFRAPALTAVSLWQFSPAHVQGRPVRQWVQLEMVILPE